MTSAEEGRRRRWRFTIVVLAVVASLPMPAAGAGLQRMVLAPAGCFVLAPGGYSDAAAYCLDQSRAPPPEGAILSNVSASLDRATVRSGGTASLTLAQALAQQVVRIEGRGNDQRLRLRNLTDRTVEICIGAPTVVMGNGETDTKDLDRIRGEIAQLLAHVPDPSDARAQAATQLKLWDLVNKTDQEENAALTRDLVPLPLLTHAPKPAVSAPGRGKCAAGPVGADVKLCID